MQSVTPTKNLHIGGVGCKMCRFWERYGEQQVALYSLPDTNWGRCLNNLNVDECRRNEQAFTDTSKDRLNVDIERLSDDMVVMSTTENYSCSRFKGKAHENK